MGMQDGKNAAVELIQMMIEDKFSESPSLYIAKVTSIDPLTVQPLMSDEQGRKYHAVTGCRQLVTANPKVGSDVLVSVVPASLENYKTGTTFRNNPDRQYSLDSSVVLGAIK